MLPPLLAGLMPPPPAARQEIGSGTGCHLELFAAKLPHLRWQPSEYIPGHAADVGKIGAARDLDGDKDSTLTLIDTYGSTRFPNVMPAVALDAAADWKSWPAAATTKAGAFQACEDAGAQRTVWSHQFWAHTRARRA